MEHLTKQEILDKLDWYAKNLLKLEWHMLDKYDEYIAEAKLRGLIPHHGEVRLLGRLWSAR